MTLAEKAKNHLKNIRSNAKVQEAENQAVTVGTGFALGLVEGSMGDTVDLGFAEVDTTLTVAVVGLGIGWSQGSRKAMAAGVGAATIYGYKVGRDLAQEYSKE